MAMNKQFFVVLIILFVITLLAFFSTIHVPTSSDTLIQNIEVLAQQDFNFGKVAKSMPELAVLFSKKAKNAELPMFTVVIIYDNAYVAASARLLNRIVRFLYLNANWSAAVIFLVLVICIRSFLLDIIPIIIGTIICAISGAIGGAIFGVSISLIGSFGLALIDMLEGPMGAIFDAIIDFTIRCAQSGAIIGVIIGLVIGMIFAISQLMNSQKPSYF